MLNHAFKKRKINNIKKMKNKKFDYCKYVKNFYMDDNVAYISCNVSSINEIVSHYSVKDYEWLDSGFADFIEENAYYIPVGYPITIEICGGYFNEDEKQLISSIIKDYFGLKLGDKQIALESNSRKAILLLIFGIISFIMSFLLVRVDFIKNFAEWIIIVFWFFIWEFIEVITLERSEIKMEKIEAATLASVNVIFSDIKKD